MDKTFNTLLELQKIDKVIFDSEEELSKMPKETEIKENMFREKESRFLEAKADLEAINREREEKEKYIEERKQFVTRNEEKLYMLKTYKEFNETQKEITNAKKEIKDLEDEVVEYFEKIEEKENYFKKIEDDFNESKKDFENFRKESEKRKAEIDKIVQGKLKSRNKLIKGIDKNILSQYDLIKSRRQGIAVAKISSNTCSGCHMNLPPQIVIEVMKKNKIIQCPSCQRILIWENEQGKD